MGFHLRRQIREGVASAITGLATTAGRVYQSRVYPLQSAELPGLLISTDSETAEVQTIHSPRIYERALAVDISIVVKATDDIDDRIDAIAAEIEVALAWPVSALASICKLLTLKGIEIEMFGTAEKPIARGKMTYEAEYYTAENAPDVAL